MLKAPASDEWPVALTPERGVTPDISTLGCTIVGVGRATNSARPMSVAQDSMSIDRRVTSPCSINLTIGKKDS